LSIAETILTDLFRVSRSSSQNRDVPYKMMKMNYDAGNDDSFFFLFYDCYDCIYSCWL